MAIVKALETYDGHVLKAVEFYDNVHSNRDYYFALGKTTPWANESDPPQPLYANNALLELIGFKRLNRCELIYPVSSNETLTYKGQKFGIASPSTARQFGARWVFISADFIGDEFPLVQYRQIGLFSRITRLPGVDLNKEVLLANEVDLVNNPPFLFYIENREFCKRQVNQTDTVRLVIEF